MRLEKRHLMTVDEVAQLGIYRAHRSKKQRIGKRVKLA